MSHFNFNSTDHNKSKSALSIDLYTSESSHTVVCFALNVQQTYGKTFSHTKCRTGQLWKGFNALPCRKIKIFFLKWFGYRHVKAEPSKINLQCFYLTAYVPMGEGYVFTGVGHSETQFGGGGVCLPQETDQNSPREMIWSIDTVGMHPTEMQFWAVVHLLITLKNAT